MSRRRPTPSTNADENSVGVGSQPSTAASSSTTAVATAATENDQFLQARDAIWTVFAAQSSILPQLSEEDQARAKAYFDRAYAIGTGIRTSANSVGRTASSVVGNLTNALWKGSETLSEGGKRVYNAAMGTMGMRALSQVLTQAVAPYNDLLALEDDDNEDGDEEYAGITSAQDGEGTNVGGMGNIERDSAK